MTPPPVINVREHQTVAFCNCGPRSIANGLRTTDSKATGREDKILGLYEKLVAATRPATSLEWFGLAKAKAGRCCARTPNLRGWIIFACIASARKTPK